MHRPSCLPLLLLATLLPGLVMAAAPAYDFRIVIDVSASMQQTDPRNLRIPALKLLNGLIPTGSRAGVWTFGKYVDTTVKWGKVDDDWRRQADLGADKIHSNARLTNIESALARARVGWDQPDTDSKRILLLLTDGKVEISNDPVKNEKSRANVLGESLAALKKAGAEVHSIALADGADEVLLKQLALETGGSFAIAQTADQLQKLFYRVFERISEPDTVAFRGKEFQIDASIKQMALLIFRGPDSQPTILIPPDSPAISAQKPRVSRWRGDQGYDLITVKNPEAGTWRIDAEMDPDNRLMVVTDLKLEVDGLPAYGSPADRYRVAAELFSRGKKIRKNSYLRFVDFKLTHTDVDGSEQQYSLSHTPVREDKGQYLYRLEQRLAEGRHSFVVSAEGSSFNRSKRFDMQVLWPVEVKIEAQAQAGVYELRLRAREEYLKPDGLVANIDIEAPDGGRDSLEVDYSLGWHRARVETSQAGLYHAHVRVSAQNYATEIYDIDLGSFSMPGVYREPPPAGSDAARAEAAEAAGEGIAAEQSINWRLVGIVVVAVNVLLMLLLLGGWFILRRRKAVAELLVEDEEVSA